MGEGWIAWPERQEMLEMKGGRKRLRLQLAFLRFEFMPGGNFLG